MGPRAGVARCRKSRLHRDSIPGPSSPYPVAIPTELLGPIGRIEAWSILPPPPRYVSATKHLDTLLTR